MENKAKIKKIILNLIIFALLIALTFTLVFKDQDVSKIFEIAMNSKWEYIFVAIFFMCIFFCAETLNINRVLKKMGEKTSFIRNIKYTLIGFFFSAITPASTGGQPIEAYTMHKEGIKMSNATLALLVQLCSFQLVTIVIGIISAIINFDVLASGLIYLFILGIVCNSMALALFAIALFSKRLSKGLINFAIKIMKFFKLKDIEERQEKINKELTYYQESAVYIKKNKLLMLKTILTTVVQMLAYYSVPFWVYKALGFNEFNLFQIVTLQATLYATVSGIPSPGSVGVSEGGFLGIFKKVYPEGIISSAMLLSRGISFYLAIIISAIIVIINTFKENRKTVD